MRLTPFVTLFAAGAVSVAACGGDNSGTAAAQQSGAVRASVGA